MNIKVEEDIARLIENIQIPEDDSLGFGKYLSPVMITCEFRDERWGPTKVETYKKIELDPCTKVLHYGQEIFEGLKAYKKDENNIYLFRPERNAKRFNHSASRMAMPEFPEERFIEACELISKYSKKIIPRRLGESLYIRPFMIASEVGLGIAPAKKFLFIVVASPSGNYFADEEVKVFIEREGTRAAPGGTGTAKTGGNYAAGLLSGINNQRRGYHQTLWLDALEKKYIEEMSGMNFFAVIGDELHTPELTDTILEGITRDTILTLATEMGKKVVERKIEINDLLNDIEKGNCKEAFICGTASVIVPVASFHEENGEFIKLEHPEGDFSIKLKEKLLNIQAGLEDSPVPEWIHPISLD